MATSQLAENQQCSYEVFGKKHDMACTTQKRAAFQVMGSKTMQCSPAFPLVLTSYKLLEIERTVIETCLTATLRPILLQRIWITPSGHEFTKLGRSMYQRLSLADVGVCMHA